MTEDIPTSRIVYSSIQKQREELNSAGNENEENEQDAAKKEIFKIVKVHYISITTNTQTKHRDNDRI